MVTDDTVMPTVPCLSKVWHNRSCHSDELLTRPLEKGMSPTHHPPTGTLPPQSQGGVKAKSSRGDIISSVSVPSHPSPYLRTEALFGVKIRPLAP